MAKKIILYVLAIIFHIIPRDKHLWLTGKVALWEYESVPPLFFDNSKYFYLYLAKKTDEKVYWISSSDEEIKLLKSMALPVVRFRSLKGILLTLRAKYFFHHYGPNQIKEELQYGSIQIDFWHGTPLKKIRFDVIDKEERKKNYLIDYLDRGAVELVSSTSPFLSEKILAHAFDVPINQIINYGYPRMDVLKLTKDQTIDFCKKYSKELLPYISKAQMYENVLLYMPTWREDDPDYFMKADIDFELLSYKLKKINATLFIKLHPLTRFVGIDTFDNIIQIENDVDIYPFLVFTDFLVTDYSSIFFDYLVLNKEIIFIPYDFRNYTEKRKLYFEYNEITPGIKYNSFREFIDNIENIRKLDYSNSRRRIRELFINEYNFDACHNTYLFVKNNY